MKMVDLTGDVLAAAESSDARRADAHVREFTLGGGHILEAHVDDLAVALGKPAQHFCGIRLSFDLGEYRRVLFECQLIRGRPPDAAVKTLKALVEPPLVRLKPVPRTSQYDLS